MNVSGEKETHREGCSSPHGNECQSCESTADFQHNRCHNGRLRRFMAPFLLVLVLLGGLAALSCASGHGWSDLGLESLVSRAVDSSSGNGTFVNKKRKPNFI